MDINKILIGALQQCDTKDLVEDTFSRFNISNSCQKTDHLIGAMGDPKVFFAQNENDIEGRYSTILSMFLTGEWKMNKLYGRMGL